MQRDRDAGVRPGGRNGAAGGALELGDEVLRTASEREMEVVDAPAYVAGGERRFGVRVVGEVHFQLAGGGQRRVVNSTAVSEGVAGAVEVEENGAVETAAVDNAGGGKLLFTFGRELVGDDVAANSGEHIAGVPVAVFMEARHNYFNGQPPCFSMTVSISFIRRMVSERATTIFW